MTKQVFTWLPDIDWDLDEEPKVNSIEFSGYEQRIRDGINNDPLKFDLTFTRDKSEIEAIRQFLKAHGGVDSFQWVTPQSYVGLFVARKWRTNTHEESLRRLSVVFEEVYS
ncbi:MAG: phage tail protein [Methylomicrobium sp.]|nr:phage tail protein [Methylomicrobium sp.]